ncbi:hypothetical protein CEXT_707551 [Caerostris extrusa]|uniref:Uncharacterized protein n=1 Tax=Caerostris extrusa TaxID=172846 RepID=A0AAV4Y7C1_CAEEX|nr:hypothetical protein CEXT_707551 [Caerostris extrusa]
MSCNQSSAPCRVGAYLRVVIHSKGKSFPNKHHYQQQKVIFITNLKESPVPNNQQLPEPNKTIIFLPNESGSTLPRNPEPKYLNIPNDPLSRTTNLQNFSPPFESGTSTDRPSIWPPQTLPFKFSDTSAMNTRANYRTARTDLSRRDECPPATRAQLANYLPPNESGNTLPRNPEPKYLNIPNSPLSGTTNLQNFSPSPFESGTSTDGPSISPPRHFRSNFLTPVQGTREQTIALIYRAGDECTTVINGPPCIAHDGLRPPIFHTPTQTSPIFTLCWTRLDKVIR